MQPTMLARQRRLRVSKVIAVASFTTALVLLRHRRSVWSRLRNLVATARRAICILLLTLRVLTDIAAQTSQLLTAKYRNARGGSERDGGVAVMEERDNNDMRWQTSVVALVEALASPSGQRVVSTAVTAAVREAMRHNSFFASPSPQAKLRRDGMVSSSTVPRGQTGNSPGGASSSTMTSATTDWTKVVGGVLTSDGGRQLVVDVAQRVTQTALPYVLSSQHSQTLGSGGGSAMTSPGRRVGGRGTLMGSGTGDGSSSRAMVATGKGTGLSGGGQGDGKMPVWRQVAALAASEPALTADVVRVVVAQGVRSYVTTRADLARRGNGEGEEGAVNGDSVNGDDVVDGGNVVGRGGWGVWLPTGEGATSVWRAVARRVAVDVRRRLYVGGSGTAAAGWTVF